tara:strand:- start:3000 stop:3326 length:327 start_codon:yes stop_codon:yes gene_type:complete
MSRINTFLFISLAAFLGAYMRWFLNSLLLANIIGCFTFGLFVYSKRYKFFICMGFCGALTTFSGVINEMMTFFSNENYFGLFSYLFYSYLLGLLAIYLGVKINTLFSN